MPSDTRIGLALQALAEPRARFRHALDIARDQMHAWLAGHQERGDGRSRFTVNELGAFAAGRIDSDRFAALFSPEAGIAPEAGRRVEACIAVLDELRACDDALFCCSVPPGGDLRAVVDGAYALAGRAFGAVLGFQAAKAGTYRDDRHGPMLEAFPFAKWNRAERLLAPPLVLEVDGADVRGESLVDFIDGATKLVLVIRGPSTPAPLARLVSPGVLVAQGDERLDLALLAGAPGPAVAALVTDGAARFTHAPRPGAPLAERLRIEHLPGTTPRATIGGRSGVQQQEELLVLAELARAAEPAPVRVIEPAALIGGAAPGPRPNDPQAVDALATWLLGAAGFDAAARGGTAS